METTNTCVGFSKIPSCIFLQISELKDIVVFSAHENRNLIQTQIAILTLDAKDLKIIPALDILKKQCG